MSLGANIPDRVTAGGPGATVDHTFEEPVKYITIVWPSAGGNRTGICHMPWKKGCRLQLYLKQQPLAQYGLLGMWKRCKTVDQHRNKVKLNYMPQPGDTFVMSRVKQ